MALFERDYDEAYRPTNRSYWSRSGRPIYSPGERDRSGPYERKARGYGQWGEDYFGRDYGEDYRFSGRGRRYGHEFDRGYRRDLGGSYDQGYKSRWETDYGDPFGDRQRRTPMRVVHGKTRAYDRGMRREYPMGYVPYAVREGYDVDYDQRAYRTGQGGYDRNWF